jgi:hypothetical protein
VEGVVDSRGASWAAATLEPMELLAGRTGVMEGGKDPLRSPAFLCASETLGLDTVVVGFARDDPSLTFLCVGRASSSSWSWSCGRIFVAAGSFCWSSGCWSAQNCELPGGCSREEALARWREPVAVEAAEAAREEASSVRWVIWVSSGVPGRGAEGEVLR